jgi:serine/threonine-protein kinase PknG
LSFDFTGFTSTYQYSLPERSGVPVFAEFESFHRLLLRATEYRAAYRFPSAAEFSEQLAGVLREVVAVTTGQQRPGRSTVFGPELRTFGSEVVATDGQSGYSRLPGWEEVIDALPTPLPDPADPAADLIATVGPADPELMLERLGKAPESSPEAPLARARARMALGQTAGARRDLDGAARSASSAVEPDWRLHWYGGLISLSARRPREARDAFEAVYGMVPGEVAPKLALAVATEYCGDYAGAARFYELVWRTDRNYVSAAFGLARAYLAQSDRAGALGVLESVPDRSVHHVAARSAAITIRARTPPDAAGVESELLSAGRSLEALRVEPKRHHELAVQVLSAALEHVLARKVATRRTGDAPAAEQAGTPKLLGGELTERQLRLGLERSYRALARLTGDSAARIALVDRANAVRPRTLR